MLSAKPLKYVVPKFIFHYNKQQQYNNNIIKCENIRRCKKQNAAGDVTSRQFKQGFSTSVPHIF